MRQKKIILSALALMALASCNKEDGFEQNPSQNTTAEVQFTADTPTTRITADSEWQTDDLIGIFADNTSGTAIASNSCYKIKGDYRREMEYFSGDKIFKPNTGETAFYYAYYPYSTILNGTKLGVDLTTNQKPLVWAMETNKSGTWVPLRFYHQLVRLNLTLTAGGGDIENLAGVGTVTLKGANAKGQFDVKTGLWDDAQTQKADIPITIESSGTSKTVTAYVMPTTSPDANVSVIVTANGKTFVWQPTTTDWRAMHTYDYNITVGN